MDFDSGFTGPVDWSFPSPSATPTHGSFGNDIFSTPKTANLPSHFQDAFTTPQMTTTGATPRPHSFQATTPQQLQQDLAAAGYVQAQSPQMYHQHAVNMAPPLPNLVPGTPTSYSREQTAATQQPASQDSTPAQQVRTPPPTRGSSLRKPQSLPQQHHHQVAFGTPSTIANRRIVSPQHQQQQQASIPFPLNTQQHSHHHTHQQQQIPSAFTTMPMPQAFNPFTSLGPATAPVQSSTMSFWDSLTSPENKGQLSALDDPFSSTTSVHDAWSSSMASASSSQTSQQQANLSTGLTFAFDETLTTMPSSQDTVISAGSSMPASVDPSLVYSSPVRALPRPNSRIERLPLNSSLLESKRRVSSNAKHARTDTSSSGESAHTRPNAMLRRSNTTGSTRSALHDDVLERVQPPRTVSPLKRVGRTPLGSISESFKQKPRSSVVLTVDESGLARTQTLSQEDSPTKEMRAKYPALFDSDSSDAESDDGSDLSSRRASFAFNRRDERRQKSVRLEPPIGELAGLSIPRSASSSSMRSMISPSRAAVTAAAQLRRQGSLRKSNPVRRSSSRKSLAAPIDTCPMNAQWAGDSPEKDEEYDFLPAVPRSQRSSSAMQSALDAHNRRWNMLSNEHTQAGAAMPFDQSARKMRCVCGNTSDQGAIVQCMLCTQWSHSGCVGVDDVNAGFTCFLCTRPAQVV